MPSTLRKIGYSAFKKCKNLKRVKLPGALEHIGAMCFSRRGLEEVKLPVCVKMVAVCVFYCYE